MQLASADSLPYATAMGSPTVRKYALSVDPDDEVDFAEPVEWFWKRLSALGFEHSENYVFRYHDVECLMKFELVASRDGYFVFLYVQAQDEHRYRADEVASAFDAHLIDTSGIRRAARPREE